MSPRLRHAAAVASFALATLLSSASPAPATTASTTEPSTEPAACGADEVSVVVDFNEIGGETRVVCAPGGGTAAQLFEQSGFPLGTANAPGMQGFVCTVSGLPENGPCGQGTAYWSLWWSEGAGESEDWAYASLGVTQLEVEPGGYLGFAWHEGSGKVQPPDVALPGDGDAAGGVEARDGDQVVEGAREPVADEDDGGVPVWLLVGGAVVVLGAAAAVPLSRRRQRHQGRT